MCTPYIESRKKVAMATSLRTLKSAMSSSDSLNPSITNCLVAIVYTKPVKLIAILVPQLVAIATTLSVSGPHIIHDSDGLYPSPIIRTASRSV